MLDSSILSNQQNVNFFLLQLIKSKRKRRKFEIFKSLALHCFSSLIYSLSSADLCFCHPTIFVHEHLLFYANTAIIIIIMVVLAIVNWWHVHKVWTVNTKNPFSIIWLYSQKKQKFVSTWWHFNINNNSMLRTKSVIPNFPFMILVAPPTHEIVCVCALSLILQ